MTFWPYLPLSNLLEMTHQDHVFQFPGGYSFPLWCWRWAHNLFQDRESSFLVWPCWKPSSCHHFQPLCIHLQQSFLLKCPLSLLNCTPATTQLSNILVFLIDTFPGPISYWRWTRTCPSSENLKLFNEFIFSIVRFGLKRCSLSLLRRATATVVPLTPTNDKSFYKGKTSQHI